MFKGQEGSDAPNDLFTSGSQKPPLSDCVIVWEIMLLHQTKKAEREQTSNCKWLIVILQYSRGILWNNALSNYSKWLKWFKELARIFMYAVGSVDSTLNDWDLSVTTELDHSVITNLTTPWWMSSMWAAKKRKKRQTSTLENDYRSQESVIF